MIACFSGFELSERSEFLKPEKQVSIDLQRLLLINTLNNYNISMYNLFYTIISARKKQLQPKTAVI